MDFFVPHSKKQVSHPFIILKKMAENGALKVFQDHTGHAEKTEITVPKGKVVVIKDYEQVPALAHYKRIVVESAEGTPLGTLEVFPEDKTMMTRTVRIFQGTGQIGLGTGDIGMAIARKLLTINEDTRLSSDASIDAEVIEVINELLGSR
jgi:hypothetical protein